MTTESFTCAKCGDVRTPDPDCIGAGYGKNDKGEKTCYRCCGKRDRETMIKDGHSKRLPLYYVTERTEDGHHTPGYVANWPGTLSFGIRYRKTGRHNIAGTRTDVWFNGPDGHVWHGTQYRENTDVCHAKRTKEVTA